MTFGQPRCLVTFYYVYTSVGNLSHIQQHNIQNIPVTQFRFISIGRVVFLVFTGVFLYQSRFYASAPVQDGPQLYDFYDKKQVHNAVVKCSGMFCILSFSLPLHQTISIVYSIIDGALHNSPHVLWKTTANALSKNTQSVMKSLLALNHQWFPRGQWYNRTDVRGAVRCFPLKLQEKERISLIPYSKEMVCSN